MILTREEALFLGAKHFFTGVPCRNGHVDKRFVSSGNCVSCNRKGQARFYSTPSGKAYHKAKALCSASRRAKAILTSLSEIEQFYRDCPPGWHVDHIIPRHNKFIVGTHSLSNLQYLPAQENQRKHNRIDPLTLEAVICVLPEYRTYLSARDLQNSGIVL